MDETPDDVAQLKRENRELRARLDALEQDRRRQRERQTWVLKRGGSLLVPLIDRQRVVRNFIALFRICVGFSGARESWPKRDDVQAAGEAFAVSLLRLFIRRRLFLFLLGLAGLAMPLLQVWLIREQNRLVDLQNQLIEIQADDIVARGITTSDPVANQLNGALLSGRDFADLSWMLRRVFGTVMGDAVGGAAMEGEERAQYLKSTAGRAHLLLALSEAIGSPSMRDGRSARPAQVWGILTDARRGALPAVLQDAPLRALVLLRSPHSAFGGVLEVECRRYVLGLTLVMRRAYSLAAAAGRQDEFFKLVAPLFAQISNLRASKDSPFAKTFALMFRELLLDLVVEWPYGATEQPAPPADVDAAVGQGFARLEQGIGPGAGVAWPNLKALFGIK